MPSHFIFYGGKGGVGKTTCAAARAVAEARRGRRVFVVSTDPAHSLGDALGVPLSARVTEVPLAGATFSAMELDAPRAFARWLGEHRQLLGDIIEHGTWLDTQDVEALLALPIPGIDELLALVEIVRLAGALPERGRPRASGQYDLVIVDTAPIGHTLRLLAAPETVGVVAAVLDDLQQHHRLIRQQLARVRRREAADRLIGLLAKQAQETGDLLRDPERATFHWVMLPEDLSLAESETALRRLSDARIPVADVIVNRVIPDGPPCPICDRRRAEERRVLARVRRTIGKHRAVRIVPAELREPRGLRALVAIGRHVSSRSREASRLPGRRRAALPAGRASADLKVGPAKTGTVRTSLEMFQGTRLLLFGGKGGVGKTTTAAAVTICLARAEPRRRLLLLSTDPAPSLADIFRVPIGDRPTAVGGAPPNLTVRQLDAPAALAARRAALEAALEEIVTAFGADTVVTAGGRGVSELMDLAPPGIDELFGLVSVIELLSPAHGTRAGVVYDTIVIDTAPTGHALRLLEMPDAAREWVQVLLRMLLKYRDLVRPGQLAAELVELSKSLRALQDLLRNCVHTRFIVVTRAAEVPRLETARLLNALRRLRLAVPAVVVNAMTLSPGRCPRCRVTASAEQRELAALAHACRRIFHECAIIQTPLAAPPPRGVAALARWAHTWISHDHRTAR